ncbi:MAG TPA: type II and III secretion system protein family protein [Aliidongia sp.]|uniref:type II and III secretion system protein family protein n=1 Tax=Aliidongia sp. TaxID=1914230 RepID=UPI002DDCA207|nr:type II and III secretion system protein family protein [Aliidongia sp.]HEV2676368.1 type II and III secretion system protein family protein [Aliidongia sp.]
MKSFAVVMLLVLGAAGFGRPVEAAGTAIVVEVSQGKLISLSVPATTVFIADPTIADVQVPMPTRVFVLGRKAGHTTLYALGADGQQIAAMDVEVRNASDAVQKSIIVDPDARDVQVKGTNSGLALEGTARDPAAAYRANQIANGFQKDGDALDDRLKVKSSAQVSIRVRIAEVSRSVTKELGFNWNAMLTTGAFRFGLNTGRVVYPAVQTGPGTYVPGPFTPDPTGAGSGIVGAMTSHVNFDSVIDALAQDGLISILAEPNLTALSGEKASFLAGGEFPIPIAQNQNAVTIEFKQYGVSLDFVPTVLASNHISMHVRPEVSQLSTDGAITLGGVQIPGLSVRRADTTIELGSGESFAIGGLLQNNTSSTISRYPGLGDIPVLGALFRSSNFTRNESELIIIVTPYIVKPIADPKMIRLPTDGLRPPTDIERMLLGRIGGIRKEGSEYDDRLAVERLSGPRLQGDAGFELE